MTPAPRSVATRPPTLPSVGVGRGSVEINIHNHKHIRTQSLHFRLIPDVRSALSFISSFLPSPPLHISPWRQRSSSPNPLLVSSSIRTSSPSRELWFDNTHSTGHQTTWPLCLTAHTSVWQAPSGVPGLMIRRWFAKVLADRTTPNRAFARDFLPKAEDLLWMDARIPVARFRVPLCPRRRQMHRYSSSWLSDHFF